MAEAKDKSPVETASDLVATLLDASLVAMLGFLLLNACAPRQDLPWTQLKLTDPLGNGTAGKLRRETAELASCQAFLQREGIGFTPSPDRTEGGFCIVEGAGALAQPEPRLYPAGPLMTCRLAATYAVWTRQSVEPAALALLGQPVAGVDHFGTYACRRVYNQAEGRPSTHARAEALDVAGFRLKNGRRVSVQQAWTADTPDARFLKRVRAEACGLFSSVLSPDYNAAHANHLHLDVGPGYGLCR
jgi:hypothetical protein